MYNACMIKIFGYLVALIILAGLAFLLYERVPHLPGSVSTSEVGTTTVQSANLHEETSTYLINMNYPVTGIASVDAAVQHDIQQAVDEFKTYPANPPDSAVPKNQLDSDVGPIYVGTDVVSVELLISEYTGGAHPNTAIVAINIDPRSGRALTLQDALSLIGRSLNDVAQESLAQLKQKLGDDVIFEEGAQPTPENYQTFMVTKDGVTFAFQNYQVAPYAAGPQFITFARVK